MGWHMRCEVHRAAAYEGDIAVDDPDGIVVEAEFVPVAALDERLATCAPWVREPLAGVARRTVGRRRTAPAVPLRGAGHRPHRARGHEALRLRCARPRPRSCTSISTRSTRRSSSSLDPTLRGRPVVVGGLGAAGRGRRPRATRPARSACTRRCRWPGPGARARTRCSSRRASTEYERVQRPGDGDPAVGHAARRTALARRGVPRRRRARAGCSATGPRSARYVRAPHPRRDRAGRVGRGRDDEVPRQDRERPGQARRDARRRARAPSSRSSTRCRVGRLWGVGPATLGAARSARRRARSATSRELPEATLVAALGASHGAHLSQLAAQHRRPRRRRPSARTKSIGHEETFATDCADRAGARARDRAPGRPRRRPAARTPRLEARTVTLKLRFGDFTTITRSRTEPEPTALSRRHRGDRARAARGGRRRRRASACSASRARSSTTRPRCSQGVLDLDGAATATTGRATTQCGADRGRERRSDAVRARFGRGARSAAWQSLVRHRPPATRDGDVLQHRARRLRAHRHRALVRAGAARPTRASSTRDVAADLRRRRATRRAARQEPRRRRGRVARRAASTTSTSCGSARGPPAHLEAVEAAVARGLAGVLREAAGADLAACERCAATLERVPHQVGLVLRYAPVFATAPSSSRSGRYGRPLAIVLRDDQYFPIQGMYGSTWREDVAKAGGGTLIEHSIHDVDVLHWILGDPRDGVRRRPPRRSATRGSRTSRRSRCGTRRGATAQLVERVAPGALRGRRAAGSRCSARTRTLWTEDDYLGPAARRDQRRRPR